MRIICDKQTLTNAISGVSKAVTARSNIPVLEGVLIKAEGGGVTLTGYDLEIAIKTTFEADVKKEGEVVLSARLLFDIVRRLEGDRVTIEIDQNLGSTIKDSFTEFNLVGMPAADFPELPAYEEDQSIDLPSDMFKKMVEKTIYAVSSDEKKPAHTGELFKIENGVLTIVALDGYRLAICTGEVISDKNIQVIVPSKTMHEVAKLIDEKEGLKVFINRRYIVFKAANYTILSRLIEGEFLDYRKVIPQEFKTSAQLNVRSFSDSIERASLIINERIKNPLRITFNDNNVTVRCQTAIGKVVDEFSAEVKGEEIEIGFNNRYLLEALRNSGCEEVILQMPGPLSPAIIKPVKGDEFLFLVLPVRFKND